ncbi:MAG: GNAT family N-acetyltransferase [Chloroflexi bacterium]|nr:GNAT family N-acetyltransferase [Chloroflexota bacterium]MDA1146338.1 GNAT family N-acetyltransferase [Chloroflexota bacterium]
MTVELREITRDNLRAVLDLRVTKEQDAVVASNAVSIAQAHFEPDAWFRAIYVADQLVGFVQGVDIPGEHFSYLWRLMIDAQYQNRGYGAATMAQVIERAGQQTGVDRIVLSYLDHPNSAAGFYERLGFRPTGERDGDDIVVMLLLHDDG